MGSLLNAAHAAHGGEHFARLTIVSSNQGRAAR
ncbi:hypothetical protein J2X50_002980 [Aminobacter sp. BE322]